MTPPPGVDEVLKAVGARNGGGRIKLGYGAIAICGVVVMSFVPLMVVVAFVGGPAMAPWVLACAVGLPIVFLIGAFVFAALNPASALLGGGDYTLWHRQEITALGLRGRPMIVGDDRLTANPEVMEQPGDA